MKTLITMTNQEITKYEIIKNLIAGNINGSDASIQTGLSIRQIRRLKKRVKEQGIEGVAHKNRGRKSNRKTSSQIKELVISHIKKDYYDFGPTLAQEKLEERDNLKLSIPTIRSIMIEKGLWQIRKVRTKEYHAWRERKECFGEMIQFDGSYHDWFENKEKYCLLGGIDDATGKVTARFYPNEGIVPVFKYWKRYLKKQGKPVSIYLDRYSTYKVNTKSALKKLTQFQQAMKALNIRLIHAHSPQAKGRIERMFKTFQDRLVKEMRLEKINNPKKGNQFLEEVFLPEFNSRFNVVPKREKNLHTRLNKFEKKELESIFSIKSYGIVNNDYTIQHKNIWYQLEEEQSLKIYPSDDIIVEKRTNGEIYLRKNNQYLNYKILPQRPSKLIMQLSEQQRNRITYVTKVPPKNHPWRKPFFFKRKVKIPASLNI